ncbi:MAG TPA: ferritin family protein [Candidatus Kapabacteria bacterium]|nr:ferritin family protein [Candidatus Kapabacteria bacterium]
MLRLKGINVFTFFMFWGVVTFFLIGGDNRPQDETDVLKNLLAAYNSESDTYNLYQLFAGKAKEEGYPRVALLFRAAMGSVAVQMKNHAEAIKEMGGTPKSDLKPLIVKSTAENLQEAIKYESEKLNVYPVFLANARQKRDKPALRTFNFSKTITAEHLNFFNEAAANPGTWKTVNERYWVCSVCGNMVTALNFTQCPVCFNPLSKYDEVK